MSDSSGRLTVDPAIAVPRPRVGGATLTWATGLDLAALLVLFGAGATAFGRVFASTAGYRAAIGSVLIGLTIATIGAWRRIGVLGVAGLISFSYFAFGTALAVPSLGILGFVPTMTSLRRLLLLAVESWRDLLTVTVPADDFIGPAVVPFLAGLVLASIAGGIALRTNRYLWALLPAGLFLVVGILWGTKSAPLAAAQGAVFAVAALAWGSWRAAVARSAASGWQLGRESGFSGSAVRRSIAGALTALVAVGVAVSVGPAWGADANRHVLRDDVVPPFDPRAFASPLTQYRYLETDLAKQALLTVHGLPKDARLHLATLDTYDGDVYNVDAASAGYRHIGTTLDVGNRTGTPTRIGVTIGEYQGIWLPGGGDVRGVRFRGAGADARADGLYYNEATGTALTTAGLGKGAAYDVDVVLPDRPSDEVLAKATTRQVTLPPNQAVPEAVGATAADLVGDSTTAYAQLTALATRLRTEGFYADGTQQPSRSGHTAERIASMLAAPQWIGDDEQYGVLMGLMARELGHPARVVMGFYAGPDTATADGATVFTGADVHVWVEVAFQPDSWVAFDATPDRDRVPKVEVKKQRLTPKPQVLNPPEPPRSDADRPVDYQGVKKDPDDLSGTPIWQRLGLLAAKGIGGAAVLASPFLLVLIAKRRRRRARRRAPVIADRVSGGWEELRDATVDLGSPPLRPATRREHAATLLTHYPAVDVMPLATSVDGIVFGPIEPTAEDARRMWDELDALLLGIRRSVPRRRRFSAAISLKSLRRPGPDRDTRSGAPAQAPSATERHSRFRAAMGRMGPRRPRGQ